MVERVLDAGGTILGKAVCESLCFSGGSHTADSGPVRNPYDPTRSTGGSSTGSAALVAAGEVDLAIGGDQGGSVRIPSCWSGIYGLKPTWGRSPATSPGCGWPWSARGSASPGCQRPTSTRRSGTRPAPSSGSGPRSRRSRSLGTATRWPSGTRSRWREPRRSWLPARAWPAEPGPLRDRPGRHLRRGPPRPLLRQGPEPGPHRHRRLRPGLGRPRPAGHADPAAERRPSSRSPTALWRSMWPGPWR